MKRVLAGVLLIAGCASRSQLYVASIALSGRTLIVTKCPFGEVATQQCITETIPLPAPRAGVPR